MLLASHSQSRLIQAIIAIDFLSRRQHNNNEILDSFSAVYLLETYCHESLNSHHSSKRQVSGHRLSMDWPMASSTKDKSAHKPQLQATGAGASSWHSLPLQPQQATGAGALHQFRIFPLLQQMITTMIDIRTSGCWTSSRHKFLCTSRSHGGHWFCWSRAWLHFSGPRRNSFCTFHFGSLAPTCLYRRVCGRPWGICRR